MARELGTPTWLDLNTTDLAASTEFYEGLFGWTFEDTGEQTDHYRMIRKDGNLVGGAMDVSGMTCPDGDPLTSGWDVYLTVDDVDARARLAVDHGGRVIVEPGDAGAAGRFAMVIDATDAVIGLWQAGDIEGYEFSGATGTPVWFELLTQDIGAAQRFYTEVAGFALQPMAEPMADTEQNANYFTNGPADEASSGICDVRGFVPEQDGSFWRVYFAVDGCDRAIEHVRELGGLVTDGPMDSPFGRIATVEDPTGASFQIVSPREAVPEDAERG